jgi:hypothetical protein
VKKVDDQSETSPAVDFEVESFSDFQKALREHVGASDDDLSSEAVADDITLRQRHEEAPTPENASERPITRMRSKGGPLTVQEASDDIRFSRARQQGADLAAAGYSQDQINEFARSKIEAALDGSPDNPEPPVEVKIPLEFGQSEGEPLTASEAAAKLTDWRAQQEATRQAELAELVGAQEAQQAQQPQQQPEPQQQQPQQPDPVQTERQQLAAERRWIEHVKKMEGTEAALRNDYDQLVAAVVAEFPSLRNGPPNPAHVEQLRQQDPARFRKLAMADQMLRERQQRIAALAQQRSVHEQQRAAQEAAQLERWAQTQNAIIDAELPDQSVHELSARLAKASGREAIRLGTALQRAKRAMNGG